MPADHLLSVAINTGLGFNLWLKEESIDYVPVSEEKATSAQVETIKELCEKHKISLNDWCRCNGKTVKTLSSRDIGIMLKAIKNKYGDD